LANCTEQNVSQTSHPKIVRRVSPEDIATLAHLAGIQVGHEDLSPLAVSLEQHLNATELLLQADLEDVMPSMEARWNV
jgi:Asp-tRNA(Asn)/Glu-tRNA(Gln) amidotransferase C subunit